MGIQGEGNGGQGQRENTNPVPADAILAFDNGLDLAHDGLDLQGTIGKETELPVSCHGGIVIQLSQVQTCCLASSVPKANVSYLSKLSASSARKKAICQSSGLLASIG